MTDAPNTSPEQTGSLGQAASDRRTALPEQTGPGGQAAFGQPTALPDQTGSAGEAASEQPTTLAEAAAAVERTVCSRAGCRDLAIWALRWRNPRIHSADRRKTWVACDEHVVYLREFLSARDFPVEVAALAARPE